MALKQAQTDRGTSLSLISNLNGIVDNLKMFFQKFNKIRDAIEGI